MAIVMLGAFRFDRRNCKADLRLYKVGPIQTAKLGPDQSTEIKALISQVQVLEYKYKLRRSALDSEPVLHEQLEPGDLVVVQFAAVGNCVPDSVELRENRLHRLLAS